MALLLVSAALIPAIPASAGQERENPALPPQDFGPVNHTEINESALAQYHQPPQEVTVFHVEVSETSLPGPRYMAFGPSSIRLSLDPGVLIMLVTLVSVAGAAWSLVAIGRWGRKDLRSGNL